MITDHSASFVGNLPLSPAGKEKGEDQQRKKGARRKDRRISLGWMRRITSSNWKWAILSVGTMNEFHDDGVLEESVFCAPGMSPFTAAVVRNLSEMVLLHDVCRRGFSVCLFLFVTFLISFGLGKQKPKSTGEIGRIPHAHVFHVSHVSWWQLMWSLFPSSLPPATLYWRLAPGTWQLATAHCPLPTATPLSPAATRRQDAARCPDGWEATGHADHFCCSPTAICVSDAPAHQRQRTEFRPHQPASPAPPALPRPSIVSRFLHVICT